MRLRELLACGLAIWAFSAAAQLADVDPDWKEADAPPPPAFDLKRLVPFDVAPGSQLSFGVDPASISIGSDGIVRYVVVARSRTGTVNAMYEGLRCTTGEVRTYARHNPDSGWSRVEGGLWRSLWDNQPSRHSLMFARQGGCAGRAPPRNVQEIVRDLRNQDPEKTR